MTDDKKKFVEDLPEADKPLYSVNFLVATFNPIKDMQRDERLLRNKLPSQHYQSRDFATARFYKGISTPLSRFAPLVTEDE